MFPAEPSTLSPSVIAGALLAAARKLGLEGTFLRIAAEELPDTCCSEAVAADDDVVTTRTTHCCVPGCAAAPESCLSALKVEQMVSRKKGRPYAVESLRLDGEELIVRLRPFV